MFGRRRVNGPVGHDATVRQWRRHDLLYRLLNPRRGEIVLIDEDIARSLRRDGLLTEDGHPENWKVTPQGRAAYARWGANGPGRFPS